MKKNEKRDSIIQFLKFCMVGTANTVVYQGVYMIAIFLGCNYLVSNILGYGLCILNAYFMSGKFVFKEDENKAQRVWWEVLLKTYASYMFGFAVSSLLLVFWMEVVKLDQLLAVWFTGKVWFAGNIISIGVIKLSVTELAAILIPAINIVIVGPLNYLTNKYWAYKQPEEVISDKERKVHKVHRAREAE